MNKAVFFIFLTLLIDITGIGLILPVLPAFIRELGHASLGSASLIGGWLLFAYAMPQFLFAPVMGNLSDRFGRRPVLLASLLGLGIDNLIMGFAPALSWLFAGRIVAGAFGASVTTATAYIADVSSPEKRTANFGLIGAAFGIGFFLGPLIGGFLGEYGARIPFFAAAGLAFANVVFGYFVLPESLAPENRRPFDIRRANPLGAFKNIAENRIVVGLAAAFLLSEVAHHAYPSTWTYFTIERFAFSPREIGLSLGIFGLLYALATGWLIRIAVAKFKEATVLKAGFFFSLAGFLGFGVLTENWMLWAMFPPAALGGLLDPAMRAIMANETQNDAQGELQGALSSLTGIAAIAGPLLMTRLFADFTEGGQENAHYAPGAPFLAAALLLLAALLPISTALKRHREQNAVNTPPH